MPRSPRQDCAGPAAAVRGAIADPHVDVVYVVGPAGSGKSFLLDRLTSLRDADASTTGERVERVGPLDPADCPLASLRPSQGTDDLALAELLPLLHEPPRMAPPTPAPDSDRRPRVLAIDDIDQLDQSSLALLGKAIDQHRIRLVATMRSKAARQVLGALRISGGSAVVTMLPWKRHDLDAFVERRLGGRMHSLTAARILDFTGGNALCVTELVDVASATGSLRQEHDVWFCEEGPWVPPVTAARVGSDLPRVSEVGRDVIDTAALVGGVPLVDLEQAYGVAAIEEADETGVLKIEQHQGRLVVTVRSPIEARVIVHRLSTTRARRLNKVFAAAHASTGGSDSRATAAESQDVSQPAARLVRVLMTAGPARALALARTIDAASFTPQQQVALAAVTGWCHLFAGSLAPAQEYADLLQRRGVEEDDARTYQLGALLTGRTRLAAGDAVGARFALIEAVVLRADKACASAARLALSPLALAYSMTGQYLDAVRTLDAARIGAGALGLRAGLDQLTRAEILLENGLHHAAAERAAAVAARCPATGQLLLAVQALHLCVRARPTTTVADDLRELADRLDYDLARTYWRHAVAGATGDGAAMADVATVYDGLGFRRLAGETAARALSLGDSGPAPAWAPASRWMLHQVRSDPRITVPAWWWDEDVGYAVLTEREREIAELAASGSSSPHIAERLQLSRRTVENHLQHVYRKLGIVRRAQLPDALRRTAAVWPSTTHNGGGP